MLWWEIEQCSAQPTNIPKEFKKPKRQNSICWKDFPLCWKHLHSNIMVFCCFGESLRRPFPMRYKPNMSPAVLQQFLIQMKGPKELLQNILHKIPSLSPALPHTGSRTWHVKGDAVQEHKSWFLRLPQLQKTSGISGSLPCAFTLSSADSQVPFWSARCCSSWCQCWQEFLEMPQTPPAAVGSDCLSPHTDILGKQGTCHCCGHF